MRWDVRWDCLEAGHARLPACLMVVPVDNLRTFCFFKLPTADCRLMSLCCWLLTAICVSRLRETHIIPILLLLLLLLHTLNLTWLDNSWHSILTRLTTEACHSPAQHISPAHTYATPMLFYKQKLLFKSRPAATTFDGGGDSGGGDDDDAASRSWAKRSARLWQTAAVCYYVQRCSSQ